jgi:hypothetical protein
MRSIRGAIALVTHTCIPEKIMPEAPSSAAPRRGFSIDTWAVALAIVLALLVRFNVIRVIPW